MQWQEIENIIECQFSKPTDITTLQTVEAN